MIRSVYVEFVVVSETLGQAFFKPFSFPHQYHSITAPNSLMYHVEDGQ